MVEGKLPVVRRTARDPGGRLITRLGDVMLGILVIDDWVGSRRAGCCKKLKSSPNLFVTHRLDIALRRLSATR